jgi:4'-phosphopantetheinyl transferase
MMLHSQPPVFILPEQEAAAVAFLRSEGFAILCWHREENVNRTAARVFVREQLSAVLAQVHGLSPSDIQIISTHVEAPAIQIGKDRYPLSLSYDGHYAVAAIHSEHSIGVDVMSVVTDFDWRSTAQLYLSPQVFELLNSTDAALQFKTFLQYWAQNEAALKCCGLPLQEWSADIALVLANYKHQSFTMPDGAIIAYAIKNCMHIGN